MKKFIKYCVLQKLLLFLLGFFFMPVFTSVVAAQDSAKGGTISFAIGSAIGNLEEKQFSDEYNEQNTGGFIFSYGGSLPIRFDFGAFVGLEFTVPGEAKPGQEINTLIVSELNLGVAYYLINTVSYHNESGFQLHGGGGLARISVKNNAVYVLGDESVESFETGKAQYSGSGSGHYFSFGGSYVFVGGFTLGLNIRSSSSKFELGCDSTTTNEDSIYFCDGNLYAEDYGLRRTLLTIGYSWE